MSRIALTIVLAASLLGGCLGAATKDDESTQPASVKENATATAATLPTNASPAMSMATMIPVSYQGTTPQGACTTTGTPADACQFADPGKESYHVIAYTGKASHLRVNVTYPAQQPGFEMYWTLCVGKPGEAAQRAVCKDYKTAASPAKADFDLANVPAGSVLAFSIGSVAGPGPGAIVFAQSEFKVDGHLMTELAADPMAGMAM